MARVGRWEGQVCNTLPAGGEIFSTQAWKDSSSTTAQAMAVTSAPWPPALLKERQYLSGPWGGGGVSMQGRFALGVKIALLIRSSSIREQLGDARKKITRDPGCSGAFQTGKLGPTPGQAQQWAGAAWGRWTSLPGRWMSLPGRWMSLLSAAGLAKSPPPSTEPYSPPQSFPTSLSHSYGRLETLSLWKHARKALFLSALCCHTSHDYVVQAIFNLCICYFTSSTMDHRGLDFVAFVLYPEPNTTGAPEHSIFWVCCQLALDRRPGAQCAPMAKRKAPAQAGSSLNSKSSEEPRHRMRSRPGLQVASHSSKREPVLPRQTIT